jgi:hypothetical protein
MRKACGALSVAPDMLVIDALKIDVASGRKRT